MILHLGVIDVPYVRAPTRRGKPRGGTVTTGDVAGWLENRYHVLEIFYRENEAQVGKAVENSLEGSIETFLLGGPLNANAFGTATSEIEDMMKRWIAEGRMDALGYPGVPTQAAIDRAAGRRRSARFKRARATNARPISFYDTGLYQASLKAWVD